MTLLDDVRSLQSDLVDVSTLAQRDLVGVWNQVSDWDARTASQVVLTATPEIVDQYSTVAGALTAEFYNDLSPGSAYVARAAAGPPAAQVEGSTRWALGALYRDGKASPLDLLAGSLQRMVFQTSRNTILEGVRGESGSTWARYASANACKFCAMLATRSDVYSSKKDAGGTRGTRYHDHCRCMAVPVRPGAVYEPPDYVERWTDEYQSASQASDGSAKSVLNEWQKATT